MEFAGTQLWVYGFFYRAMELFVNFMGLWNVSVHGGLGSMDFVYGTFRELYGSMELFGNFMGVEGLWNFSV